MPDLRIPRRSGPHRTAAIALYRALLTQCRAVPLAQEQRDELQNVVRNRFQQSQHVHSTRRLGVSFEAGYEAIDHLDAAVAGDDESKSYIASLLERAPAKIKQARQTNLTVTTSVKAASEYENGAQDAKISLFDRPLSLEKLTGKRHVPVLFSANQIPVLRIKKPQPESLSRYIRQRITKRQARHDRRFRLLDEQEIAMREDEWDDLIEEDTGQSLTDVFRHETREPPWAHAVKHAIWDLQAKFDEEREKNQIVAEKMQGVVDREKELFEKERAERREIKRRQRLEKKQALEAAQSRSEPVN